MTVNANILTRAIRAALGYIAIMAVGMFTAGHVFGYRYGDERIVYVLVVFEAAMSLYGVVMARRLFGAWQCGFGATDWRGMIWLLPNFALMAALWIALFRTGTISLSGLALTIVVTMGLVGFSEELTFRGIALQGGLRGTTPGKAILISAALFSLLHSVNTLAYVPLDGMIQQMALTFVFGLAMGCYALRVNSLVPLMVFHALWDMVQFLGGIWRADFGPLVLIGIAVNAAVALVLWTLDIRKRRTAV